jgi:hypothetical protein
LSTVSAVSTRPDLIAMWAELARPKLLAAAIPVAAVSTPVWRAWSESPPSLRPSPCGLLGCLAPTWIVVILGAIDEADGKIGVDDCPIWVEEHPPVAVLP